MASTNGSTPVARPPVRQMTADQDPRDASPPPAAAAERTAPTPWDRLDATRHDSLSATMLPEALDRASHAALARITGGLSPAALAVAQIDWLAHLAMAPGKQIELTQKAARKQMRFWRHAAQCALAGGNAPPCIEPLPQDRRFKGETWSSPPWSLFYQSFLLTQQWWHNATTTVPGVSDAHERMLAFATRQALDVFSPSNSILTNPTLLQTTLLQGGWNLARGWWNAMEDVERHLGGRPPVGSEAFEPGRDVAVTQGQVVFRNTLIELIQYAPMTEQTHPEPVLITPAWIMKYYILDLSPHNSLVRFLVEQGFTVFMISWRNPGPSERNLGMEDYLRLGVLSALDAVGCIAPGRRVHAVGYCIGGTLAAIAAAALARGGDDRLQSLSLLAAQTDFTEPGELQLFINESQVRFLEDLMWEQGFLDATQMAGAFFMLRSRDLVWSKILNAYLLGERAPMTDLMAWNADGTRMPYAMHAEYLRRLFLDNDLAEGRYPVAGRPVAISDIRAPIFAVGTTADHVAPWRSVYKIHLLADAEVTFLLTSGGHNAGIVSEPGHRGRSYQIAGKRESDPHRDPEAWAAETPRRDGSWWPEWAGWLAARSGPMGSPPGMGAPDQGCAPVCEAPGSYIFGR